jgi:hypothetical protein
MKSTGDIPRGSLSAWDERGHDPMTFKRNLQSLAVLLLVLGRSACLFFGQMGVHHATLLSVINKTPIFPSNADFNQISSVWAKCRKWQAVSEFKDSRFP